MIEIVVDFKLNVAHTGDIHGPKVAEAVQKAELIELRSQIHALAGPLKEQIRIKYMKEKDVRQRELQVRQSASWMSHRFFEIS